MATTQDPAQRKAATAEAMRLLATDAPVVPLFFAGGAFAYRAAVYDGWVYVKGTGILDKRSFVQGEAGAGPVPTTAPAATTPRGPVEEPGEGLSAARLIAVVVFGLACVLGVVATLGALRDRRPRPR